jgi:cytochrome c-type biogenesis protein CcmE
MNRKTQRLIAIGAALGVLGLAAALIASAMRDNIVFFRTPSEIATGKVAPGVQTRIGGLVVGNSLVRESDGLTVLFRVTDNDHELGVRYRGILPDLFREGQGVVAEGRLREGIFEASTVLAKHDENYVPREVAQTLKKPE